MRIISDYDQTREILNSDHFGPHPMGDLYRDVAARLGRNFDATINLLDRMPLLLDGDTHKQQRKITAQLGERTRSAQIAAAAAFLDEYGPGHLLAGAEIDLVAELVKPLFQAMNHAALIEMGLPITLLDLVEELPWLFWKTTPLKRRIDLNDRLTAAVTVHGEDLYDQLGFQILGSRPFLGSLVFSLHDILARHPATPLSAIDWPGLLPVSAVPFMGRRCNHAQTVGEHDFEPGDRARCLIQNPDWTEKQRQAMMWGTGGHLCLGRALTLAVWEKTTQMFAASHCTAHVGALEMSNESDLIDLPKSCVIRLTA